MQSAAIQKLLNERYYLEDESTWGQLAQRVSAIYPPIFDDINEMKFIPSSPTLMNANTRGLRQGTLSSCFTMGIEDSIEGIMDSAKEAALVTKACGGVGYVFSTLRASNEQIKTIKRISSGPVPFMRIFNVLLDGISQGGSRKGAGMAQFDITHPNILDVIRLKNTKGEMERLNISIRIPDNFYENLKAYPEAPHLVSTVSEDGWHPLKDDGKVVSVKQVWDEIIEYAWLCAEPGIFNSDIAFRQCTVTNLSPLVLSNPCAEYTNIAYSSCNLGSINLTKFVVNGNFDWVGFKRAVRNATRFLNNVIDVNEFPIEKIKDVTLKVRPIGLGVMGYAHMFFLMGIPFNSLTANQLTNDIFNMMTLVSMDESAEIAKETGVVYPAYDYDLFMEANSRFFKLNSLLGDTNSKIQFVKELEAKIKQYGIANSCFTSIAPTGSISYLANTSGGIEPLFALTYGRKIEKHNKEYEIVYISDPLFDKYLTTTFDEKTKIKILKQVAEEKGSCQNVKEIPEKMRKVFVVASDLTPMEHLDSLAIVAKNTSLSVSKTINLPADATREEISEVYLKAHELGVIGVTVYRDGCRDGILFHGTDQHNNDTIVKTNAPKRPKKLPCHVYRTNAFNRVTNESEKWIMFVGLLGDDPYEIIAGKINGSDFDNNITEGEMVKAKRDGKTIYQFVHNGEILVDNVQGAYLNELREYVTRLMSLALRHGASIEYLREVLQKSNGTIVDFNKAIIRNINKYVKDVKSKERCPTCNAELIYVEGCIKCSDLECSYTKCS